MRMLLFPILLLSILFVSFGCSKDLSREEAARILKEHPRAAISRVDFISEHYYSPKHHDGNILYKDMAALQDAGYIKFNLKPLCEEGIYYHDEYNVTILDKLKPYISKEGSDYIEVMIAKLFTDEVTGVRKLSDTEYEVEYKVSIELTPLLDVLNYNNKEFKKTNNIDIRERTVTMMLYDDGWRPMLDIDKPHF